MKIEFDLNEFEKIKHKLEDDEVCDIVTGFTFPSNIEDYVLFKFIIEGKADRLLELCEDKLQNFCSLWEEGLYIKVIENDNGDIIDIEPRQKLINLFPQSKGVEFDHFWNKWHEVTSKPKTDRAAAEKKWKGLTNKEKQKALDNIENYFESLNDKKYCKKARTYLEDKNFNDEFETTYQEDWTKEHK